MSVFAIQGNKYVYWNSLAERVLQTRAGKKVGSDIPGPWFACVFVFDVCRGGGGVCMYLVSSRQLRSAQCNFNPIQPHPHPPSSAELVRLVILCSAAVGLRHHVINACRVVKLLRGRGRNNSRHARPQELVIIHEPGGG